MRTINIGDTVTMIEVWPNNDSVLVPDTTTYDCRLYGYCRDVLPDGCILATSQPDDNLTNALNFPTTMNNNTRQGDSIAFHADDAAELYPIVQPAT